MKRSDRLKGFTQAIQDVVPLALVRASLHYVNWKERKVRQQNCAWRL